MDTKVGGTTARYPSAEARGIPGFTLDVPDGYVLTEAPGALLAMAASAPSAGFWSNVLVSHRRVARGIELAALGRAAVDRLRRSAPDLVVRSERYGRFEGHPASQSTYLCGVELNAAPSGRRIAQGHALLFAPEHGERTSDLLHVVGTCPVEASDDFARTIVGVVSSLRFG